LVNVKYKRQFDAGNVEFLCIGKQGERQLKHRAINTGANKNEIYDSITFGNVAEIALEIMNGFAEKKYDRVELVYNQFKNAAVQVQICEQFLPVKIDEEESHGNLHDFIYEPSKENIIQELIPQSLKIQFYKALLDSYASEHGARMTAMHQATDNATALLGEFTLQYNKARQATITNEILEIVSGAEALKG
jgi:F-type H+-transporting ATPase subunit gamma